MELVDGPAVRDWLAAHGPKRAKALTIAADVCSVLEFCHRNGVIHRGITAGNVMLTANGQVKVSPPSEAGVIEQADDDTDASAALSASYLPPEVAQGGTADARSDIYSTGCLLYELLTGGPPFTGDSAVAVAYKHVVEAPVAPSQRNARLSAEIDAVVLKALAKAPDDRYQTAAGMRAPSCALAGSRLVTHRRGRYTCAPPAGREPATSGPDRRIERPTRARVARRMPAPAPPPPPPRRVVTIRDPRVLRITPASRLRVEDHGEETYTFDNSKSSSTSTETIRIARTSKVEITVDTSKARSVDGQARVTFFDLVSAEGRIQQEIRAQHSLALQVSWSSSKRRRSASPR